MKKRRTSICTSIDIDSNQEIELFDSDIENNYFTKKLNVLDINEIVTYNEVNLFTKSNQFYTNSTWQDAKKGLYFPTNLTDEKFRELINLKDQYGKILPFYQFNRNLNGDIIYKYINNTNMDDLMNDFIDNIIISKIDNKLDSLLCFNKDNDKYHCINLGLEFSEMKKNNGERMYNFSTFKNQEKYNYNFLCKLCLIKQVSHYDFKIYVFNKIKSETNDFTELIHCCLNSDCNTDFLSYILPKIENKFDFEKIVCYENCFRISCRILYNYNAKLIIENLQNDNFRIKFLLNNFNNLNYLSKKIFKYIIFKNTDYVIYKKYIKMLTYSNTFYNETLFKYTNFYDHNINNQDINYIFTNRQFSDSSCNTERMWDKEIKFICSNDKYKSFFINFLKSNLNKIKDVHYAQNYFLKFELYSICNLNFDNYVLLFKNLYYLKDKYSPLYNITQFLIILQTDDFYEKLKKGNNIVKFYNTILITYLKDCLIKKCIDQNNFYENFKIVNFYSKFYKILIKISNTKKNNYKYIDKKNFNFNIPYQIQYLKIFNDICNQNKNIEKIINNYYYLKNITFIDNLVNNRNELNNYSNFMLFHTKKISNIIEYNLCVFYNFNISIFSLLYKIRILVNNNEFTSILSNFTINKSYLMEFIKERKINLEDLYNPGRTQEINLLSNKLSLDNINYIIDFLLPNHNDLQIIINNNISIKRQSVQKPLYYKSNDFFDRFFGL